MREPYLPRWYYLIWFGLAAACLWEIHWYFTFAEAEYWPFVLYPAIGFSLFGSLGAYQMVCARRWYRRR